MLFFSKVSILNKRGLQPKMLQTESHAVFVFTVIFENFPQTANILEKHKAQVQVQAPAQAPV